MKHDLWPFDFTEMKDNGKSIKFAPVVVTIRKVFPPEPGKNAAWSFKEDTTPRKNSQYTGEIWRHKGHWNAQREHFPYTEPLFNEGDRVEVVLTVKEGDSIWFRDVLSIKLAQEAPQAHANGAGDSYPHRDAEPVAQGQQGAQNTVQPLEQRILLGMAFNNLSVMLASGIPDKALNLAVVDAPEDWGGKWAQWHKWFFEASQGRPLSPVQPPPQDDEEPRYTGEPEPESVAERAGAAVAEARREMGATLTDAEKAARDEQIESLPW